MNFDAIKNIHFVGIGGIGMSGIAEILASRGKTVSGCDLKPSSTTDFILARGIPVTIGHDPSHLDGVDAIVVTSAVKGQNAEVDAAIRRGLPVIKRKEILGRIVNAKRAVGVSGTHGKTTTSAMISVILEEAGLDPTILIGGMLRNIGSNAKDGKGDLLVVEADEYDRTFHELHPEIAVITNIEADHLEYYGSLEAIEESFRVFARNVKRVIIGCADEPAVDRLLKNVTTKVIRYGLAKTADVTATDIAFDQRGTAFNVPGVGFFRLFVPGEHNVRNALAAIAVTRELGVDPKIIAAALSKFLGVDRRFQILGEYAGAIVVDDYAHHPTEIRATLQAARKGYPERRIVALFQPHLYSRTRDFAREFGESLLVADVALVAPIYAAREAPVEGVTSRLIAEAAPGVEYIDRSNDDIVKEMRARLGANDLFITMGAGDICDVGEALVE